MALLKFLQERYCKLALCLLSGLLHMTTAGPQCGQLFPGLRRIFHGVDLTSLDLYAFGKDNSLGGLRAELFNLTCTKGVTRSNGSANFSVPDQVDKFVSNPPNSEAHPVVCTRLGCYKKQMLIGSQINLNTLRGAFSSTARFQDAQKKILLSKCMLGEIHEDQNNFSITLLPPEQFPISLPDYLNLNDSFLVQPKWYNRFIETFGTHYFASAIFGVRHQEQTIVKPAYFYSTTAGHVGDNLQAHFQKKFDKLDVAFQRNTKTTPRLFGQPSYPWLLSGTLKPISDLFQIKLIKEQMSVAIEARLAKAALVEWKRDLELIQQIPHLSWFLFGSFAPWTILSQIDSCLSMTVPNPAEVNQIGNLVETLTEFVSAINGKSFSKSLVKSRKSGHLNDHQTNYSQSLKLLN